MKPQLLDYQVDREGVIRHTHRSHLNEPIPRGFGRGRKIHGRRMEGAIKSTM